MGRFYQTADSQFVDYIYKPPFDMLKEALLQQQSDYDVTLAKTSLFDNIDVNYIEDPVERQKVQEKQEYYKSKADEITNKMYASNADDWRKNIPELNKLTRELQKDYSTGDIHKIQSSAANYKAMEEHLKTIKDPIMKQKAREDFLNQWKANPNRSLDNTFQYQDVYDKKDLTGEFLAEWTKDFPADSKSIASAFLTKNGRYINSSKKDIEIREGAAKAYPEFIKAKGYEPYLQQEQRYGLGNYFDKSGKLLDYTDPRGSMFNQSNYVGKSDYVKESKADKDLKADAFALADQEQAYKKEFEVFKWAQAKANKPEDLPISSTKDASFYYNHTKEGKQVVLKYNNELAKLATSMGAKTPADYDKYINIIRANPEKYPSQSGYLQTIDNNLNVNMRAGTDYFRNLGLSQDKIDIIDDKFSDKGVPKILSTKEGYVDFGTIGGKSYINKGASKGEKVTINSLIGKSLKGLPGYEDTIIKSVEIQDGTTGFMPGTDEDNTSGVSTTILITPEVGEPFYKEFYIGGDPLNIGF